MCRDLFYSNVSKVDIISYVNIDYQSSSHNADTSGCVWLRCLIQQPVQESCGLSSYKTSSKVICENNNRLKELYIKKDRSRRNVYKKNTTLNFQKDYPYI